MRRSVSYLFRHACRLVCMLGLVCGLISCGWQEAKEVIVLADSIDQTEHVIYNDMMALRKAISSLDNPFGRMLMSNTLGKAYYYMGRNYSLSNQIAEAADCYIEADRLQIDDPIYRGRVNSCMGYICAQNCSDSLALIFYERASEDFKESGNEWRYAQTLLSRSYYHINIQQFKASDCLLQKSLSYSLDSNYQARYYETRGLYFYAQQQYDSALVYFPRGLDYWQSETDKMYSYLKMMQIYLDIDSIENALSFAHIIIEKTNNPNYLVNAYYCLLLYAKAQQDVNLLSTYSHAREDANRLLNENMSNYAEALPILEEYVQNPYPWRWVWIVLYAFAILCVALVVGIFLYRKFMIAQIRMSNEQISSLSAQVNEQANEIHKHTTLHHYDRRLESLRKKYPHPLPSWNKYEQLKKDLNPYLKSWLLALEELKLTTRDNVFCVLSFIYPQMPIDNLASSMCITKAALFVRKTNVTKKLGITSSQLSDFLQKLPHNE